MCRPGVSQIKNPNENIFGGRYIADLETLLTYGFPFLLQSALADIARAIPAPIASATDINLPTELPW